MTDRRLLMIQSIGSDPKDTFKRWMEIEEPIHKEYCARHGADYEYFAGEMEPGLHPTWNRIPMFLDAFKRGYDKVIWLDADTLVVNQERSVWDETSNTAPLLMTRVLSSHYEFPWASRDDNGEVVPADKWDVYNDGVLICNNTPHAVACMEFVWENRRSPFEPWHVPGIPELDWILDYVYKHPDAVEQMTHAWNWMPYPEAVPYEEAVIVAWHGADHRSRWHGFQQALKRHYGIVV